MSAGVVMLVITLVLWSAGWILLGRVRFCRRGEANQSVFAEPLSIIIPARNEERNLPGLLRSLVAQSVRLHEIIVVDDASADRTVEVACGFGARVVKAPPLPDGWRGKTWACHQGVQVATGEWFLFLDADTWFEADGLRRVLGEFEAAGGGVLSVAPYHVVLGIHEQFSAFFNLVMHAGAGAFTLLGDRLVPRGLFGQFMLIERTAYNRVGGHEAVKGRILENFWLAERLRAAGVPLHCRGGRGIFSFRMYPNCLNDLVEGWTKGFASGAARTPLPILLLVVAWMTGLILAPLGLAFAGQPLSWFAAYGLCAVQVTWLLRCVGTFRWTTAVFYPAPLIFYFVVFARSALRSRRKQTVAWKGRQIRAD